MDPILKSKEDHLQSLENDLKFPHIIQNTLDHYAKEIAQLESELGSLRKRHDGLIAHRDNLPTAIEAAREAIAAYKIASKDRVIAVAKTQAAQIIAQATAQGIDLAALLEQLRAQQASE